MNLKITAEHVAASVGTDPILVALTEKFGGTWNWTKKWNVVANDALTYRLSRDADLWCDDFRASNTGTWHMPEVPVELVLRKGK